MTSAEPGEPLAVYLGAAGELVPPEGSPSISGRCSRSFHESRAGGSACAPSSPSSARVCGGAASDSFPEPPRGLSLPPPCYICGSATALVLQVRKLRREIHRLNETRDEKLGNRMTRPDGHLDLLSLSKKKKKKNISTPRSCRRTRTAPCSSSRACRTGTGARGSRRPGSG